MRAMLALLCFCALLAYRHGMEQTPVPQMRCCQECEVSGNIARQLFEKGHELAAHEMIKTHGYMLLQQRPACLEPFLRKAWHVPLTREQHEAIVFAENPQLDRQYGGRG